MRIANLQRTQSTKYHHNWNANHHLTLLLSVMVNFDWCDTPMLRTSYKRSHTSSLSKKKQEKTTKGILSYPIILLPTHWQSKTSTRAQPRLSINYPFSHLSIALCLRPTSLTLTLIPISIPISPFSDPHLLHFIMLPSFHFTSLHFLHLYQSTWYLYDIYASMMCIHCSSYIVYHTLYIIYYYQHYSPL